MTYNEKRTSTVNIREDMRQHWTKNANDRSYCDQFGFKIYWDTHGGNHYRLEHKGAPVMISELNTLAAAQEISTILLNDKVFQDHDE